MRQQQQQQQQQQQGSSVTAAAVILVELRSVYQLVFMPLLLTQHSPLPLGLVHVFSSAHSHTKMTVAAVCSISSK
jgi:hypothetical protein